ncbi:MAG TPA: SRPBCC family protein [Ktedonobacterales bacterium]|nr:SRPBCC family protein [Ktedonobacterales bacterium]
MAHVEGQIIIHRPVDEVFDFVADERNEPRYNPQMLRAEQTSAGPIGVGATFRAVSMSLGRPVEMTIAFTAYERPRRLMSTTQLATMDIQGTLTFAPVPVGTQMNWSWKLKPRGVFKLMAPLITCIGRRQEKMIWTGLKRYLEASPTSQSFQSQAER